jgi:CheY-like chemotaxis protein
MAPVTHADRVDARTVLVADDDEDFRAALAEALEEDGYNVVAVPSGAAALAARLGAEAVLDWPLDHARLRTAAEALVPVLREFDRDVETRGYSFH